MPNLRPELIAPPEIFYGIDEAKKYKSNTREVTETKLVERAIELLNTANSQPTLILDIGCGSCISGEVLTENDYQWIGIDISGAMLDVALEKNVEGGLIEGDIGNGLPFRQAIFDGCISISTIQWLCYVSKSDQIPAERIKRFFSSLYSVLKIGSRAIFQFTPTSPNQIEILTKYALKAGFTGGVVVDYPNSTKAKKIFLCLSAGYMMTSLPEALVDCDDDIADNLPSIDKNIVGKQKFKKPPKKSRQWIIDKKERLRNKGIETRHDSKYTGRRRKPKF